MTILAGSSDTTGYTASATANGYVASVYRFIYRSFTASQTGTATKVYFYSRSNNLNNLKFCIFSGDGATLLGSTGDVVNGEGWINGTLDTPVSITASTSYLIGFYVTGYGDFYGGAGACLYSEVGTYASPAGPVDNDGAASLDFQAYADGTVGASVDQIQLRWQIG